MISLEQQVNKFSFLEATMFAASLCTFPNLQRFELRLEELLANTTKYCRGDHKPSKSTVAKWITTSLASISMMEDPCEKPMIMNVCTSTSNYEVFEGLSTGTSTHLEFLCAMLERPDLDPKLLAHKKQAHSLLLLGDLIINRLGLPTYSGNVWLSSFNMPALSEITRATNALTFSMSKLLDEYPELDLSPFIALDPTIYEQELPEEQGPILERYPLFLDDDTLYVFAPTFLAMALRRNIYEGVVALKQEKWFAAAQREQQTLKAIEIFSRIKDVEKIPNPFHETTIDPKLEVSSNFFGIFDQDKILQLSLIHFDPTTALREGILSTNKISSDIENAYSDFLKNHVGPHFKHLGHNSGILLYIACGTGEYCYLGFNGMPENWSAIGMSLSDLEIISYDEGFSFSRIQKYVREMDRCREHDIMMIPSWEVLPLYSQWRLNEYVFFGRTMQFPGINMFAVASDACFPFVSDILKKVDPLAFYVPLAKKCLKFRRFGYNSFFSYDLYKSIYTSYAMAEEQVLYGIVHTEPLSWHLITDTKLSKMHPQTMYRFWEMLLTRLLQIAEYAKIHKLNVPHLSLIRLTFEEKFDWLHEPTKSEIYESTIEIIDTENISLNFSTDIFTLMKVPKNEGEKSLMTLLLIGLMEATGQAITKAEAVDIINKIDPSDDTRYVHVFQDISETSLQLFSNIPQERVLQPEDTAFFSIGLAWEVSSVTSATRIIGLPDGLKFLHKAVEKLWLQIRQQLNLYQKKEILNFCMTNINALKLDLSTWDNTSKALMALSSDPNETYRIASKKARERDTASLCNRILLEMANCECLGKTNATLSNIDELLAKISILLYLAGLRDALSADLTKPEVTIHENGEITIDNSLIKEILPNYIQALDEKTFNESMEDYESRYDKTKPSSTIEEIYGSAFVKAFEAEFSISPERLFMAWMHINALAVDKDQPNFTIHFDELSNYLIKEMAATTSELTSIKMHFILFPRDKWDGVPNGLKLDDIFPWRYQRRLSLVFRPLLAIDNEKNFLVCINVSLLWPSFNNYIYLVTHGYYKQEYAASSEMVSFLGEATNKQGIGFEKRVDAEIVSGAWKSKTSVQMSSLGAAPSLGEVDLFVWNEKTPNKIFIIECKKLKLAKTIGEIGDQLAKFKGDSGDLLDKHLSRFDWIKANANAVLAHLGIGSKNPTFIPLIVTSNPVPMQFFPKHPRLKPKDVIAFDNLKNFFKM